MTRAETAARDQAGRDGASAKIASIAPAVARAGPYCVASTAPSCAASAGVLGSAFRRRPRRRTGRRGAGTARRPLADPGGEPAERRRHRTRRPLEADFGAAADAAEFGGVVRVGAVGEGERRQELVAADDRDGRREAVALVRAAHAAEVADDGPPRPLAAQHADPGRGARPDLVEAPRRQLRMDDELRAVDERDERRVGGDAAARHRHRAPDDGVDRRHDPRRHARRDARLLGGDIAFELVLARPLLADLRRNLGPAHADLVDAALQLLEVELLVAHESAAAHRLQIIAQAIGDAALAVGLGMGAIRLVARLLDELFADGARLKQAELALDLALGVGGDGIGRRDARLLFAQPELELRELRRPL